MLVFSSKNILWKSLSASQHRSRQPHRDIHFEPLVSQDRGRSRAEWSFQAPKRTKWYKRIYHNRSRYVSNETYFQVAVFAQNDLLLLLHRGHIGRLENLHSLALVFDGNESHFAWFSRRCFVHCWFHFVITWIDGAVEFLWRFEFQSGVRPLRTIL